MSLKLLLVAGARPNFMKVAPLIHAIHRHNAAPPLRLDRGESDATLAALRGGRGAGGEVGDVSNSSAGGSTPASGVQLGASPSDSRPQRLYPNSPGSTGDSPVPAGDPPGAPPSGFHPLTTDSCPLTTDNGPLSSVLRPLTPDPRPLTPDPRPLSYVLVHTGQHYDAAMSDVFFQELGIPAPDVNLGVGSGSHAVQTANVMIGFEKVCLDQKPDWVVVFGDVNSTVACTLVAVKMGIRVAHVEAGLRSFDRTMPEEINRVVTDSIADLLLTPSQDANENLRREGVPESKIVLVGNIMIDSLVANLDKARQSVVLRKFSVQPGEFVYVTLHRPANVDDRESLTAIAAELTKLSHTLPVVFPVHPRTRKMLSEFGISLEQHNGFRLADPIGYHDSVCLAENARLVLTDSGGLQEESTYFQTPCLTLRPNTERPVTVTLGSNRLTNVADLPQDLSDILSSAPRLGRIPPLWDGKTAERIVAALPAL